MAGFIGNTPAEKYVSLETQNFTVTATASYTLSNAVTNENEIALFINNVRQQPGSSYAYTASGTTLTLSSATAGTDTMYCVYLGKSVGTINPPDGSVGTTQIEDSAVTNDKLAGSITDAKITGLSASKLTGALPAISGASLTGIPNEITQQGSDPTVRTNPAGGVGTMILNTSSGKLFICTDSTAGANVWKAGESGTVVPSYTLNYLVIAGGGGGKGNTNTAGGGGAGGYRASWNSEASGGGGSSETALTVSAGTAYTITIGAGGANSYAGNDSVFGAITSAGGGHGGHYAAGPLAGGSGGGAGPGTGGAGTANQGYAGGGNSIGGGGANADGGSGGGGAGAVGAHGTTSVGGNGGVGVASTITGSSVTRAGGGGGGRWNGSAGTGGTGGGGNGGNSSSVAPTSGTVNTGGGAGGQAYSGHTATAGGSGVVILRMPTASYSSTTTGSPTVTTDGSDTILTFNSSGSYTS